MFEHFFCLTFYEKISTLAADELLPAFPSKSAALDLILQFLVVDITQQSQNIPESA